MIFKIVVLPVIVVSAAFGIKMPLSTIQENRHPDVFDSCMKITLQGTISHWYL